MNPYRVVALDLDGTLLTSDKRVTVRSLRSLQALHDRGIRLVIVTGRNLPMARASVRDVTVPLAFVAHNGAMTAENGRVTGSCRLGGETARSVCQAFRQFGCAPAVYSYTKGDCTLAHEPGEHNPAMARYLKANAPVAQTVGRLDDDLAGPLGSGAVHVVAIEPNDGARRALSGLQGLAGVQVLSSGTLYDGSHSFLEAIPAGASKTNGLDALCKRWGVTLADVVAVGDNLNDIELLQSVGLGVAMGNASTEVIRVAARTTSSNDREGVAEALDAVFRL
ncbi:HAD family phosphatase [Candidatus Poribacteria bacterium]|nr:HAD family phosphatase [Candidatus Poribacteria bacterium]